MLQDRKCILHTILIMEDTINYNDITVTTPLGNEKLHLANTNLDNLGYCLIEKSYRELQMMQY
jgi:predicted membrane protein